MLSSGDTIKGLSGQSMGGPKTKTLPDLRVVIDTAISATSGVTSFTAPFDCYVTLYGWASGGAGFNDTGNGRNVAGGGGTGAGKKSLFLRKGQTVSWVVSSALAGNTTITLPDGTILTVTGGTTPTAYFNPGFGGTATGPWDVVKKGGDTNNAAAGNPGQDGAAGGSASGAAGGGGGAAGFTDQYANTSLLGTVGLVGQSGPIGGSGGGGVNSTTGRIVLIAVAA